MTDLALDSVRPRIGILILNWNTHRDVVSCVESIEHNPYDERRMYIIDNGSMPDSLAYIRAHVSTATFIENGANLGFCGGFNVGIRRALKDNVDIICVMNNDLRVAEDFLLQVAQAFSDPSVAAVSPKELDYFNPERVTFAGGCVTPVSSQRAGFDTRDGERSSRPGDTGMLCGSAMIFRAATLRELGGFDERLFFGGEDHEMALRLRKAGKRILFVPSAKVWHKGGGATGQHATPVTAYFGTRNYLLVATKYGSSREKLTAAFVTFAIRIPRVLWTAVRAGDLRYVTGLTLVLLWFMEPNRVPADAEVVELLMHLSRERRGRSAA